MADWNDYIGELQNEIHKISAENLELKRKVNELQQWSLNDGKVRYGYKAGVNLQLLEENKKLHKLLAEKLGEQPPIVTEEITELNEENNKLLEENKELKDKLWEIHCITYSRVLDELHKEETK